MLRLDELRRLTVDLGTRIDEIRRVELVAAVVALIAARLRVLADRARALDVPIRQGSPRRRADGARRRLLDHVPVLVQREEQLLHHLVVVRRRRAREQVVAEAEADEVVDDDARVLVRELLRRLARLLRHDDDRRAVLVGARDHEHVMTRHAHVPAVDVGGHTETGDVPDVAGAVGVRPGNSGENLGHGPILGAAADNRSLVSSPRPHHEVKAARGTWRRDRLSAGCSREPRGSRARTAASSGRRRSGRPGTRAPRRAAAGRARRESTRRR